MKNRTFLFCILLSLLLEIGILLSFIYPKKDFSQDAIAVNEIVKNIEAQWPRLDTYTSPSDLDYTVLDKNGTVLFKTKDEITETFHAAISHRDTILDIESHGKSVGKIIIYNTTDSLFASQKQQTVILLAALLSFQTIAFIGYFSYLNKILVKPFHKLKDFAKRVAGGNLDVPLEMDRQNLFGAFTESFDLMRSELKQSRLAEAKANASKKELVAKLSHDIKTPVASIKAASEVGYALSDSEKMRDNYTQIIQKADQINGLITNLFTATLEELQQLPVIPNDMESTELKALLENSDYLHRALIPEIPTCLLYCDKLRLQQVFDNIFANSYKYAATEILVSAEKRERQLSISIEDFGGGAPEAELSRLKEKFRRGSNAKNSDGAGLGLFISDYFMKEMNGELILENGTKGLKVTVILSLSGKTR